MNAGDFLNTRQLSFNSNPGIEVLPALDPDKLPKLQTLTMINCTGLKTLPDLSGLKTLRVLKLEECNLLQGPCILPTTIDFEMSQIPAHLLVVSTCTDTTTAPNQ